MRYSYGIRDRKSILAYQPHLFHKTSDLLIFPGKDFRKWHGDLTEYLDGIYQINAQIQKKGGSITILDFNLAMGMVTGIHQEMEDIFNTKKETDLSYFYVSTMEDSFKKVKTNFYGRYRHKIDRKVVHITPELKYRHLLEIVDYAHKLWDQDKNRNRKMKIKKGLKDGKGS
ncbi:MAG TPA: hypothetical protein HA271_07800 [Methanobacterium subterraneum]|uniref:Uncharacterized protein n=1 Tax=Methanobacterium subterraneum TaxID=59277 RepID=A0A7J4TJY4_9EURY|nr:hypothetical protein [Methanobacterium subterraneum]